MLKTVLDVTVPILVFWLMVTVGLELTEEDLRRVTRQLRIVLLATAAQVLLWPLVAVALLATLPLKPYIEMGILLVAACPSGGMANFYTYLGRANLALSVTLTAVSCLTAVLTMPLMLALFRTQLDDPALLSAPIPLMMGQLLFLLILPILIGMFVSRARPSLSKRHGRALLRLGIVALAALIAFVVVQEWERLFQDFTEISLTVGVLTTLMLLGGWLVGWACALGARDRFALTMVLVVRNVSIATAVAVTVLGRVEFAVFATAYFLNQVPILLAALVLFRLTRSSNPDTPKCEANGT
jgi:BASS family bile acid:Na+ symporter